jgi:hypothetical protein
MCLNCGEHPAETTKGSKTVPLCAGCKAKAGNSRGVKMTPPKPKLKAIAGGKSA